MILRWIAFAGGAAALGGGAWYFGRPEAPSTYTQPVVVAAAPVEVAEAPKDLPPLKVVQVIDLTRAYEPAPEPDPTPGEDVAKFIEVGTVPARMPYADANVKPASFWTDADPVGPERLKVMPREVDPFHLLHQDDPNTWMTKLLEESEDLWQAREELHRSWMNNQPATVHHERLKGAIGP